MSDKPAPLALTLIAEVVDVTPEDDDYEAAAWTGQAVRITLCGQEVARITDVSGNDWTIDIADTVARWLREKLG